MSSYWTSWLSSRSWRLFRTSSRLASFSTISTDSAPSCITFYGLTKSAPCSPCRSASGLQLQSLAMHAVTCHALWPPFARVLEPDCSKGFSTIFFLSSSSAARRSCTPRRPLWGILWNASFQMCLEDLLTSLSLPPAAHATMTGQASTMPVSRWLWAFCQVALQVPKKGVRHPR